MQFERFYSLNHCEVAWFAHLHHLDIRPTTLPNLGKYLAWCDDFTQIIMLIAVRPLYRVFPSDGGSPPLLSGVLMSDGGSPPPLFRVFPSDGGSPPPLPSACSLSAANWILKAHQLYPED